MKKAKQKQAHKRHSSTAGKWFLFVVLLGILGVSFFSFAKQQTPPPSKETKPNTSQALVATIQPFVREQKLQNLAAYQATDCHGRDDCFISTYQSDQPLETLRESFMTYIKEKGYNVKGYHYTTDRACKGYKQQKHQASCDTRLIKNPINEGSPIWIFSGRNEKQQEVYGTISDKTYIDADKITELPIDPGNVVIQITFTAK